MKTLNVFDPIHTSLTEPILIEASAGTGKTYSLMHLLLRLIVEKRIDIERILIVTFTKNATSELRNRLQQALLNILEIFQNESSWKQELDKLEDETLKSQIELWVQTGAITPESIRESVTEALSKIEDASIFTIHSFCQRMVKDCSFSSRSDSDAEIGDTSGLISEVVDTFVRKEIKNVSQVDQVGFLKYPGFSKILERVSALSVRSPSSQSIIFENTISFKQHLEKFRDEAPALLKKLKAAARTITYDDLLVEMEARLDNPEFVKAVREKFDAVLIDEFQDTDPLQYTIFSELFLKAPERQIPVVFVGDPKQSIYGFRSADLDTYLDSKKDIKNHLYLKKNFRSTPGLVASINTFFGLNSSASGIGSFLNSKIQYTDVEFNSSKLPLFECTSNGKLIPLSSFEVWHWSSQEPDPSNVDVLEKYEDFFLAEKIKSLLEKDIRVGSSLRKLKPSDIAILVRRRKDADGLMEELTKRQIRFIIQSDERVLESQEAQDIAAILSAMENPKSLSAMTKARVTPIFGHSIKLIEEDVQASLLARERIEKANERAKKYGVLAAFTELFKEFEVEERLLPQINGQRALTNYRHILELLHEENRKIKTVSGLLRWLERKASDDVDQETLRLESDSDLVRIETIHKSKGLEYPVVILPRTVFMAGKNVVSEVNEIVNDVKVRKFLAEATQIRSYLNGQSYAYQEEQMERVRLLYVAMTRASSLLVLPMFFKQTTKYSKLKGEKEAFPGLHGNYTKSSTLQALTGSFDPDKYFGPKTLFKTLGEELEKNNVSVKEALIEGTKNLSDDFIIPDDYSASLIRNFSTGLCPDLIPSPSRQFQSKELTKELTASDLSVGQAYPIFSAEWIRTSFSALSRGIEVLPEESPVMDELPSKDEIEEEVQVIEAQDNLRFKNPKLSAAAYGDFLHRLLEELDFRTADISNPEREDVLIPFVKNRLLSNAIETEVSAGASSTDEGESLEPAVDAHTEALVEMITDVMNVKGIPGLENFSLSQLEPDKKIAEMDFILSNPAISEDCHRLTGKQLGETLRRLDPRYSGLNLSDEQINGYLIGAIDLIFFAKGKFWVIDWKSNFLDENPSNYTKSLLDQAMDKKHYKLQYLLYLVVLKRYLETRFKRNDVYDLIGGAAYFFLRGIKASNPSQGIYFDRPKKEVLDCLNEILRNGYSEEIVQKYETSSKEETMQNDWTPEKAALQGIKNALYRVAVRKNPSKDATLLKDTLEKFLQLWKMEEEKGGVCVALSPTQEKELGVQIMEDFGLAYNVSGYSGNPHRNFGIPAIPFLIDRSEKKQTRLYSHTNFFHEALLGRKLIQLASRKVEIRPESKKLADYFKSQDIYDRPNKEQLQAIQKALSNNLSIISGGPGTGKTSSVVRILEALLEGQPEAKIYVTAPTGKAKSRLIESLIERPKIFPNVGRAYKDNRLLANTIHMWLSSPTDEGRRPDETHCLECDILVIDEASMIDSEIAFNLFNVIDTKKTRVIVLGDMYQLAAVGPGAVYADISSPDNALKGILTELKESHRFKGSSGIGSLSKLINQNTADEENQISEILSLLNNHGPLIQKNGKAGSATTEDIFLSTDLKLNPKTALTSEAEKWIAENMGRYAEAVQDILLSENGAEEKELENLWHVLNSFKPIAAVRKGPMSVQAVNNYCQKLLLSRLHCPDNSSEFYPGKVIIVRKNDLSLGVSNGDIAIIFEDKEIPGQWNAYIGDTKKILKAQLLPEYDVGFCITVHQSQGSGYDNIGVFMPFIEGDNAENTQAIGLATRELLYTAVTRAKTSCWIFSSIEVLSRSIRTRTKRNGGLAYRLKEFSITAPKPPVTENLLLDL